MDWSRELFSILFLGVLALASGVQIGWGIHHLRQRDWVSAVLVLAQGLFILLVMGLLGDDRFLPPKTSVFALAVVGMIFVGSILAQIWLLPLWVQDFGEETVTAVAWGGGFVLGGLAFAMVATLQNNVVTGICGGVFLGGTGLLWLVPGVRDAFRQAFGKGKAVPVPKTKTKRAGKRAQRNTPGAG